MRPFLLKNLGVGFCLLLILFSCSSTPDKEVSRVEPKPVEVGPKRVKVYIKQMKFQPAVVEVNKGDIIAFINKDIVVHDLTEETEKAWSSGPIQINQTWTMEAKKSADYYCSLHVVMKGKIIVK